MFLNFGKKSAKLTGTKFEYSKKTVDIYRALGFALALAGLLAILAKAF